MESIHRTENAPEIRSKLQPCPKMDEPVQLLSGENTGKVEEQEQQQEHPQDEEEYDRYKDNPDLLNETKLAGGPRLFSYDWANGFVSPFRPTPQDTLTVMLQQVKFTDFGKSMLLDLGCGDGLVLRQALETLSSSKLARAVGVDLDRALLERTRDDILLSQSNKKNEAKHSASLTTTGTSKAAQAQTTSVTRATESHQQGEKEDAVLSRLELYYGDIVEKYDQPLLPILVPSSAASTTPTMADFLQQSTHIFVYLLPAALSKLAPLLLDLVSQKHKVVLSMRWEIPELQPYLACGGSEKQFYIYQLQDDI